MSSALPQSVVSELVASVKCASYKCLVKMNQKINCNKILSFKVLELTKNDRIYSFSLIFNIMPTAGPTTQHFALSTQHCFAGEQSSSPTVVGVNFVISNYNYDIFANANALNIE